VGCRAQPASRSIHTDLPAGFHWIRLEHFEGTGNARIKLEWQQGTGTRSVIPVGNLYPAYPGFDSCPAAGAAPNPNSIQPLSELCQPTQPGLRAIVYPNITQAQSPVANTVVPNVNFSWNTGIPAPPFNLSSVPNFPSDNFSIRFYGSVIPSQTATYRLTTLADDGAILYLHNGSDWVRLINQPFQVGVFDSEPLTLTSGVAYSIILDYTEFTGSAGVQLGWKIGNATTATIIPSANLSTLFDKPIFPLPATATPTLSPTPSPSPSPSTYHVNCSLTVPANARNFPAGTLATLVVSQTPVNQLDGRVIYTLPQGTTLSVFETRPAQDGINWGRITDWEAINGRDTLWVRMKQGNNTSIDILVAGNPSACPSLTPNFLSQPTVTPGTTTPFPIAQPGCEPGRDCPHTNPNISDIDLVSFILACEAGAAAGNPAIGSLEDAIANAHVVFNRMDSGIYRGSARQVVSQSGQWDPYRFGCNSSLGLSNPAQIDPAIRTAAQNLVNGIEPVMPFDPMIDYIGLYTFGVPNPLHTASPPPVQTMLAPYCPGTIAQAMRVYINIASFGNGARPNASVFFSDSPGCQL
jgi:hypothetical protein